MTMTTADPIHDPRGAAAALTLLSDALGARQTGTTLCGPDDRVVCWNRYLETLLPELDGLFRPGVPFVEWLRRMVEHNISEQDRERLDLHVDAALARRRQDSTEPYHYRCRDGRWLSIEWRTGADGYRLELVRDVTSLPALDDRRELQAAFGTINIGFALFTADGAFISGNRRYYELFPACAKLKYTEASYRGHLRRIAESTLDADSAERLLRLAGRSPAEAEVGPAGALRLAGRDALWLGFEQRRTHSGGLMCLWQDVSEQALIQRRVEALETRLRDAIEHIPEALALYDRDDRLVLHNREYKILTGAPDALLQPGSRWDALALTVAGSGRIPDATGQEQSWIDGRRRRRERAENSLELRLDDGRWVKVSDRRTRDGGTVSITSDITDLKLRELELSRRAAMLAAISYATADLLGGDDWRTVIADLLARLGRAADVDRVVLFRIERLDDGARLQNLIEEWCAEGIDSVRYEPHNQDEIITTDDPLRALHIARRERGEAFQATIDELTGYPRAKFEHEGVRAIISVPVMVDGVWWGHINFHDCRRKRTWSDVEIEVIHSAARLLGARVERERADAELRDSELRFRSIAESVPIMITGYDDGRIIYASPPMAALVRTDPQTLIGRTTNDYYADPGERARLKTLFRQRGRLEPTKSCYRLDDGSLLPVVLDSREFDYEGQRALIGSVRDMTDQIAAEAEIDRQREALHQADKIGALGSLLAGVAHELNNPLAVLIGQATMLEDDLTATPEQEKRLRRAASIRGAAERCARIVKSFLAIARQKPADHRQIDLARLIDTVLELTGYGLRSSDIAVSRRVDPQLPPLWGEPDQINQLLLNLVINAQHALQQRPTPRRLRLSAALAAPDELLIEVADNGDGIPDELKSRVLEPFFTTKPVGAGTGIGLSLCGSIVRQHGGELSVDDAPEGGALLRVRLPLGRAAASAEPARARGPARAPGAAAPRALIVDDEPEVSEILADILRQDGFAVSTAGSGRDGLARLERASFDVILSDLRMPDLDGPGFYRALRAGRPALCRRLACITGDILNRATLDEFADVPLLEKPFTPADVRELVRALLDHNRDDRSGAAS